MQTNYSHPPVISCYLVLYDPHEIEVDLSLLVLVHPRLQYRSAEGSHVQQALNRYVIRILARERSSGSESWSDFAHYKLDFDMKNILSAGNVINHTY
jgi:hypothetical protein